MKPTFATINIRDPKSTKEVRITSELKPVILDSVINKWQTLIDLAAKLIKVPSGLIMKLNKETIEVFLKSNTNGNPYKVGETEKLIYGLYCETVIGKQEMLIVPDARKSKIWKENNPDIDINMVSYLGYPINWPDGEVFGTVCLLDNKENHYNNNYIELVNQTKMHIETDLQLLFTKLELERKNTQLNDLNNTKDKFFSIISHDLRSPFMAILGYSNLLLQNHENQNKIERTKHITPIIESANKAYELLENLLEWSSVQTGAISFNPEPAILNELIEEAVSQVSHIANKKNIKVSFLKSKKHEVLVDVLMINTILRNLITNAIKFTYANGTISIAIEERNKNLEVSVTDNGIGMDEKTMNKLFKLDEHYINRGTEDEEGTGLGLNLCKEFIEMHGGRIWVNSEPGKGSTFTFTISAN